MSSLSLVERIASLHSVPRASNDTAAMSAILADVRELERCADRLSLLCDKHIKLSTDEAGRLIDIHAWGRLAYYADHERSAFPDRRKAIYSAIDTAIAAGEG